MQVLSIVVPWQDAADLQAALDAVTAIDMHQLATMRIPPLYESGVYWRDETCLAKNIPETCERFLTAAQCLKEGAGDCDDLAPWRAAELLLQGVRARAIPQRVDGRNWHVVVQLPRGGVECPSTILGM